MVHTCFIYFSLSHVGGCGYVVNDDVNEWVIGC